ncbi:nitroreductase family protein [Nesterenkonia haasae]|uniref:hypothetical protein n=1 Tax=Nesterenkonia haasae TaxID=2587813 RepID=UPI0013911C08|nr:hypothetical protein [Nesterenkonia haasae]NDK30635.1 hypothetical protein [Nesterenkonia haasae]
MSLVIALRAHGLVVGPMTGIDAAGIDQTCHSRPGWNTMAMANVGYEPNPSDERAQSARAAAQTSSR